jgi:predicted GTPase
VLGHNVLILGQGGTGKSFLSSIIKKELTKLGKSVSITSSTGVASLNIEGITIHAWSGIGDGHFSNEQLVTKILTNFDQSNTIPEFDLELFIHCGVELARRPTG